MRHHTHHHPIGKDARRFGKRLYVRIWLAVLASMLLVALLAGAVWRLTSAELPREITITDAQGQRVGNARIEYQHQNNGPSVRVEQDDGKVFYARWSMPMQRVPFGFLGWLALIVLAAGRSARCVTAAAPVS